MMEEISSAENETGRVSRDSKWLLPAMKTGDGRCLRSKRKLNKTNWEKGTTGMLKCPKHGTRTSTQAIDSKAKKGTSGYGSTQGKTHRKTNSNRRPKRCSVKTKEYLDRYKKETPESSVEESGNVENIETQNVKSTDENITSASKRKLKLKENHNGEVLQRGSGKYTCHTCGEYFIKESKLAEHIKWIHKDNLVKHGMYASEMKDKKVTDITTTNSMDPGQIRNEEVKSDAAVAKEEQISENTYSNKCPANKSAKEDRTVTEKENEPMVVKSVNTLDLYQKFEPETVCVVNAVDKSQDSTCPFCNRSLASQKGMKAHVELHCKMAPFRCGVCGKGLLSEDQVHKHVASGSVKKKKYYVREADQNKSYKCQYCVREFAYRVTLKNHLLVCSENCETKKKKKIKCKFCNKFLNKNYMPSHLKFHENEKAHLCKICGKGFNTRSRMMNHFDMIHKQASRFQCQHCGTVFSQKSALQYHQSVLFGKCKADKISKSVFQCKLCTRTFTSLRWVTRHQNTHLVKCDSDKGLVLKDFSCSLCGKQFKSKHEHNRHMRIHTNEKPHKCDQCGMAFVQRGNLQAHMRVHTGERPYVCHLCPKSFTQQSNLKSHLVKHYNGKIPDNVKCAKMSKRDDLALENTQSDQSSTTSVMPKKNKKVDTACQTTMVSKKITPGEHAHSNRNGTIVVTVTRLEKNINVQKVSGCDMTSENGSIGEEGRVYGAESDTNETVTAGNSEIVDNKQHRLKCILYKENNSKSASLELTQPDSQEEGNVYEVQTGHKENIDARDKVITNSSLIAPDENNIYSSRAGTKAEPADSEPQETVVYVFDEAEGGMSLFPDNTDNVVYIADAVSTGNLKVEGDVGDSFDQLCASITDIGSGFAQ